MSMSSLTAVIIIFFFSGLLFGVLLEKGSSPLARLKCTRQVVRLLNGDSFIWSRLARAKPVHLLTSSTILFHWRHNCPQVAKNVLDHISIIYRLFKNSNQSCLSDPSSVHLLDETDQLFSSSTWNRPPFACRDSEANFIIWNRITSITKQSLKLPYYFFL